MAYLEAYDLPGELSVEPALASLPWPAQARANIGANFGVDPISVTSCFAAVASTGSLVILPDSDNPMALGFSSDNRIIVIWPDQIVRHIEDVWSRLHRRVEGMPRRVNFIAGPSRAADAEQASGFGALGRRRLHVVIVENRAGRAS
jgi:L-lactate dehydrogenase complex protein LldG